MAMGSNREFLQSAFLVSVAIAGFGGMAGCGNHPPRAKAPDWSPTNMAENAVSQIDASGDSQIDKKEALATPGLLDAFETLDTDGSDSISVSELQDRLELYKTLKTAFVKTTLQIKLNGRPLPGAFVKLVPEEFQRDILLPATGTTNGIGQVSPRTEGKPYPAMQPGFYRVELYRDENASDLIEVKRPLGIESSPQSRPDRNLIVVLDFEAAR